MVTKLDSNYLTVEIKDGKVKFHLLPDEYLKKMVETKEPQSEYSEIPPFVIDCVINNKPIPLQTSYLHVIDGDVVFVEPDKAA